MCTLFSALRGVPLSCPCVALCVSTPLCAPLGALFRALSAFRWRPSAGLSLCFCSGRPCSAPRGSFNAYAREGNPRFFSAVQAFFAHPLSPGALWSALRGWDLRCCRALSRAPCASPCALFGFGRGPLWAALALFLHPLCATSSHLGRALFTASALRFWGSFGGFSSPPMGSVLFAFVRLHNV